MMRKINLKNDFELLYSIINEASFVYKRVIAADLWKEPYMGEEELKDEIKNGVEFFVYEEDNEIKAVMGIQNIKNVSLVRHAYVKSKYQRLGFGKKLLMYIENLTKKDILIGTWKDAFWAVNFYKKNGYIELEKAESIFMLKKYWNVSLRQIEESTVLIKKRV